MRAEQKILQLTKSETQPHDGGSTSPKPTSMGSFSRGPTFNTNFADRIPLSTISLTDDYDDAHVKLALAMLQHNVSACLEDLHVQLANLKGRVEKQEQVSGGRKNDADDNVPDMALLAAVKAEVKVQLADAFNKGLAANVSSEQHSVEAVPGGIKQEDLLEISINRSAWEVVAFVGSSLFSKASSAVLVMILLLNVILQLLFCAAAELSLTSNDMDKIKQAEYQQWRISAHRLDFVDRTSGKTLVERVCDLDGSLSTATQQYLVKDTIETYLLTSPLTLGIPAGTLVCMLALMIWYLRVSAECMTAYRFFKAMSNVPSGRLEVKSMTDGTFQVMHLDASRKIACLVAFLLRVSIALILSYTGTESIAHTNDVSELLLNALALEVILNMDEYMFDTLVPTRAQELVDNLKPLPIPLCELLGLGGRVLFSLSVVPAALAIAYFFRVKPHLLAIREVDKILCSGNQDFAYSIDANGFAHATDNLRSKVGGIDGESMIQWELDVVTRAAFDAVPETSASNMMIWQEDIKALDKVIAFTNFSDLLNSYQSTCQDLLAFQACNDANECPPNAPESFQRFATLHTGATITSCSQLVEAGDCILYAPTVTSQVDNALITRGICPEACGCTLNPPSPFGTVHCPTSCTVKVDKKEECKDVPAQVMQSMQQLEFLQNDLQSMREAEAISFLPEDLKILGCDLVAAWQDPYSNHTIPPCSKQASAANLLSCLTVRCHDYDQALCQNAVQASNKESCKASMPRTNLPEDFPFTSESTELQISRICPRTCQTCVELPYCIVPYPFSDAANRLQEQEHFAVFWSGSSINDLEQNWGLLLRSMCPSTCQCDTRFADGCPALCTPTCNEELSGTLGSGYRGCQTFTRTGRLCQKWTAQWPHETDKDYVGLQELGDHNYCRNPMESGETIWCYTMDGSERWELCDPISSV